MIIPQQKIFFDLDQFLSVEYKERELKSLTELRINDKVAFSLYHQIIDKKRRVTDFNSVDFIFDIEFISRDIKFFTGLLYLLRPFINIPSEEKNTYYKSKYDNMYMIFVSVVHQNVYNFWDRIGDLLFYFFETSLLEKKVYFSTVIYGLPEQYRTNEHFQNLREIYEQKIKPLLKTRTQIVHYKQLETKHYLGIFQNYDDEQIKMTLEKEKREYPDFFKEHLDLCNKGFEHTLKLIDLLPDKEASELGKP